VLRRLDLPFALQVGAGAFYGPKLEWSVRDRAGRSWQCGTIQFDLVMPRRFDLVYVDEQGQRRHPVMLHRALYGSLERFLGLLLERHGVALPPWLAPVQVAVLPVAQGQSAAAQVWLARVQGAGLRAVLLDDEPLGKRIALCHAQGIPFQLVIGRQEQAAGTVTLRARGGRSSCLDEAVALAEMHRAVSESAVGGSPG
jgi:threonyl-tRNA synthetase